MSIISLGSFPPSKKIWCSHKKNETIINHMKTLSKAIIYFLERHIYKSRVYVDCHQRRPRIMKKKNRSWKSAQTSMLIIMSSDYLPTIILLCEPICLFYVIVARCGGCLPWFYRVSGIETEIKRWMELQHSSCFHFLFFFVLKNSLCHPIENANPIKNT